jgi:serine/threonine-protein kinase
MGEVFRARDTKLDRSAAIKILPSALAHNPERLARFEREAKVLASLNHPNIATIYGLEESADGKAIAMELVDGTTLKPPPSLTESLKLAVQIASALEAAHEKGITHRDLKPGNIMVTAEGHVKVLDFGLAAMGTNTPSSADSPTLTMGMTEAGMIMGTAGYMAPEQAVGKPVDRRADIWAFGVVLWEMLTGKGLFSGDTTANILANVINQDLDLNKLSAPAPIKELVHRCLDRDVKTRLQSIGEARIAIQRYLADPKPTIAAMPSRTGATKLPWMIAAGLAVVATGALWSAMRSSSTVADLKPLVRLNVDLGSEASLTSQSQMGPSAILSPDGSRLIYISKGRLFTRRLDQTDAIELAGTEGASSPFVSPDGNWVGFYAGGKLKKTSIAGGAPVILCDAIGGYGAAWGEDGNIIFTPAPFSAMKKVSSNGGVPTAATRLDAGDTAQYWPHILPGGKAVLFTSRAANLGIDVVSLQDGTRKSLLTDGAFFPRYVGGANSPGYLLYMKEGRLLAASFDPVALQIQGDSIPLVDEVAYDPGFLSAQFDIAQNGTLVYRSGVGSGMVVPTWLERNGGTRPMLAKPGAYTRPRISPDGQRLAIDIQNATSRRDVWVYDAPRDVITRLTFESGGISPSPTWTPDGRYIVFEGGGLSWIRADGSGKPQRLTESKNRQVPFSVSADGKRLAWTESGTRGPWELWSMPLEIDSNGLHGGKPEPLLQNEYDNRYPAFSPDGRWLAYTSSETGNYQVYVTSYPGKNGKWQISSVDGAYPVWSRNGHELFFRSGDNHVMVARYTVQGDSFLPEKARMWSDKLLTDLGIIGTSSFDLAPDGERVLALIPADTPEARRNQSHVNFLMNFGDELRRTVSARK